MLLVPLVPGRDPTKQNALNFIALPSFVLFPLHLLLALHLFGGSSRSKANRLFALVNLQMAAWALFHGLYVLSPDKATAWLYYRSATVAWLGIPSVVLHFLVELTEAWTARQQRIRLYLLIYLPIAALLMELFRTGRLRDNDIAHGPLGWYEHSNLLNPWAGALLAIWSGGCVASLFLVYRWQQYSNRRLEKLQGRTIVVSGTIALVTGMLYAVALPLTKPNLQFSTMSPVATGVWILGMWYAIVRYGLLRITPARAAENILQTMTEPLVITDDETRIVRVNPALEELLGVTASELVRRPLGYAMPGASLPAAEWRQRLDQGQMRDVEVSFRRPDDTKLTLVVSGARVYGRHRRSSGFVVVMRDISALKLAQEQLRELATHDPLTGLPNRTLLKDCAAQAFARSRRNQTAVAVLVLGLDGFKRINDSLGHEAGDEVLCQVAMRCKRSLRETDTVARLGGDEFVVLLTDLKHREDARIGVRRLEGLFSQPILVGSRALTIGVSIGASVFPDDGEQMETLMRVAATAMDNTKQGTKAVESATIRQVAPAPIDTQTLATALPLALQKNEFELWYQPFHEAAQGSIIGIEALLRWRHPTLGTIGPLQFLPLAERTGLVVPIGAWVLRMACIQTKAWQTQGLTQVPVAVNVSVKQLVRADFAELVKGILQECELEAQYLLLEVSELAAMHEFAAIRTTLGALNQLGIRIVVDDFGSGYSALRHLAALSVHSIKISQFLIQNMMNDPRAATIVRALASMANAFDIPAVAKGVETEEQLQFLRTLRWEPTAIPACRAVQGFVFSRPVPALELGSVLQRALKTA